MTINTLKGLLPIDNPDVSYGVLTWFETLLSYHQGKSRPHETFEKLAELQRELPLQIVHRIDAVCGTRAAPQLEAERSTLVGFLRDLEYTIGYQDAKSGRPTARRATCNYVNGFERGTQIRKLIGDSNLDTERILREVDREGWDE